MAGGVLLLVSLWQFQRTWRLVGRAQHTIGLVIDDAAHPKIRFTSRDGRQIEFVQNGFVSQPLGSSLPVIYENGNPEGTAKVATFWPLWGGVIWALAPGLGWIALAFSGARLGIRQL